MIRGFGSLGFKGFCRKLVSRSVFFRVIVERDGGTGCRCQGLVDLAIELLALCFFIFLS